MIVTDSFTGRVWFEKNGDIIQVQEIASFLLLSSDGYGGEFFQHLGKFFCNMLSDGCYLNR